MKFIKCFFTKYNYLWKIIDRIGILLGIVGFIITIFQVLPTINQTKSDIEIIQDKLSTDEAEKVLYSYFYNIEQRDFVSAFNLFSLKNQKNDSIDMFSSWLENFVAFEGLKITELKDKTSASKKVYLAEFGFKKKGMKSVYSKRGFYIVYDNSLKTWKIDYSNVLYENGYKEGACEFYKFKDYCK